MKKTAVALLALTLCMALLAGCGGKDKKDDGENAKNAENTGKYVIAADTDFAPFEFTGEENNLEGIDVDILAAVAKDQDFEYELRPLGFDAALKAAESGQADGIMAAMSITDERSKSYDFSDPYYSSSVCAAVQGGGAVGGIEDIAGNAVAVKKGTQSAAWAESIADMYDLELTYFDDSDKMYEDVAVGNSVACFEDYPVMTYGIANGSGMQLLYEEPGDFAADYGFAVKKGENTELLEKFNAGLKNIKQNGIYDKILAKYDM